MEDDRPPTPPDAAGDKPPGPARTEPLSGDVSRTASHARTATAPAGPPDPAPPPDRQPPPFIPSVQTALSDVPIQLSYWVGDWTMIVPASRLVDVATHLRDAPGAQFDFCADVTATDWPPRVERFDVIYCLYSTRLRHRVRVKTRVAEGDAVPSVTGVWPAANWLEREVFDMFGIRFDGHPDLRRILMPDAWQGYPQRKDYPLEGPGELLLENPMDWLRVKRAEEIE